MVKLWLPVIHPFTFKVITLQFLSSAFPIYFVLWALMKMPRTYLIISISVLIASIVGAAIAWWLTGDLVLMIFIVPIVVHWMLKKRAEGFKG